MDKIKLYRGQTIVSQIEQYTKYRTKVMDMIRDSNIPIQINPANTPFSYEDNIAIKNYIVNLCDKRIKQLKKEFEDL